MTSLAGINDKRLRLLVSAAVAAAHAYARSVELRPEVLLAATEFLTRVGQASDEVRKEFILLKDTKGLRMIVYDNAKGDSNGLGSSALGPFTRAGCPLNAIGGVFGGAEEKPPDNSQLMRT